MQRTTAHRLSKEPVTQWDVKQHATAIFSSTAQLGDKSQKTHLIHLIKFISTKETAPPAMLRAGPAKNPKTCRARTSPFDLLARLGQAGQYKSHIRKPSTRGVGDKGFLGPRLAAPDIVLESKPLSSLHPKIWPKSSLDYMKANVPLPPNFDWSTLEM